MKTLFKTVKKYALLLLICTLVGLALLYLAGLCPQEAVQKNLDASWPQLVSEGFGPGVLYAGHPRSTLENYTEGRILIYSYYMDTAKDPLSILTNPGWYPTDETYNEETLLADYQAVTAGGTPANTNYERYCMGFRAIVRPMLALMNYMDCRQVIMWAFFLLLGGSALSLFRRTGSFALALGYVFVISQMNPIVISACYHYAFCFFIAMAGIWLTTALPENKLSAGTLFFLLGAATQYFDFYTAPVVTYGLPMLAILTVRQAEDGEGFTLKSSLALAGKCLLAWAAAYLGMWIAKLLLVTVFSDLNGFASAFEKFSYWMSGANASGETQNYLFLALKNCFISITDYVPFAFELAFLIAFTVRVIRKKIPIQQLTRCGAYLAVALLPVLWIAASAKPAYLHMWFQYRSLAVFLAGALCFLYASAWLKRKKDKI